MKFFNNNNKSNQKQSQFRARPPIMPLIMDAAAQYHACSIENWYEDFQDVTIRTNIVKIPQDVLNYFRDDLMVLPKECYVDENDEWSDDEDEAAVEVSAASTPCRTPLIPPFHFSSLSPSSATSLRRT